MYVGRPYTYQPSAYPVRRQTYSAYGGSPTPVTRSVSYDTYAPSPSIFSGYSPPSPAPAPSSQSSQQAQIAAEAKQALAQGVQDSSPVDDVKTYSDQTGAQGSDDYYSALGYDETDA